MLGRAKAWWIKSYLPIRHDTYPVNLRHCASLTSPHFPGRPRRGLIPVPLNPSKMRVGIFTYNEGFHATPFARVAFLCFG